MDGATIAPNMDERGGFHDDAYVQVVDGQITARFGLEDLIYIMDNPQTDVRFAGYGFSPLENLIVSVTAELYSSKYNASYFEKGSIPEGLINLGPEGSPEDLNAANRYSARHGPSTHRRCARRYKRAQVATGLRPLRWHDLRHTYGSLLAASGVDLVKIQAAMGHSDLATTSRYLHARPASDQAEVFTRASRLSRAHLLLRHRCLARTYRRHPLCGETPRRVAARSSRR